MATATMPRQYDQPWEPPFLTLPTHALVEHQMRLALRGVESTLMHGPRGSGKTRLVSRVIAKIEAEQVQAQMTTGEYPIRIVWYETSKATGPKTALNDLYAKLIDRPIGKRSRQDWTPTQYIGQITERVVDENVRVIAIDEAHLIDAGNIDLLRQIPDAAAKSEHSLRLFLVGNEGLTRNVAATGQYGERFTGYIAFPPLASTQVSPHLVHFHPGLSAVRDTEGAKEWKRLVEAIFGAARGSFRRLGAIIGNAHELSVARGRPLSASDIRHAIEKLPPGDL